ncbi:unknown protein [Seminavis robusta]|uniref:Uncharacterized protein n=1 Tax=Seminavis robusta TaxID=568900 RepID=A0A9N8E683_9STRA|nr:unknown protein [Seminavis robusta]|eukprot:Sro558_g166290.1 n/a (220) ;mRNA; r:24405-25064
MAYTAKTADSSALLAHEKRNIAYPRSGPSNKNNTTGVQEDRPGPTVPVKPDSTSNNSQGQTNKSTPVTSTLLQAAKSTIKYPRGETNRTANTIMATLPPTINPVDSNSGLAVANLVVTDDTTPQDLPQAQDYSPDKNNQYIEERMKQFKTKVFLGVIVLLAITIILVATLIPQRQGDNADLVPTTTPPSSNPSQGPTSDSEYWLSLFPESTVSAIQEDP